MFDANSNGKEHSDVAPILRAVFPELPEATLREIDAGFVALFGMLHDEYIEERDKAAFLQPPLDAVT